EGHTAFLRYACKMATGSGKTTVMGMLAAWSILNKVRDRTRKEFSDFILALCPTVTIRDRLRELDPGHGDGSIYRTRDLVPEADMPDLRRGQVVVLNWHAFELRTTRPDAARVVRSGRRIETTEKVTIAAERKKGQRGRVLTPEAFIAL